MRADAARVRRLLLLSLVSSLVGENRFDAQGAHDAGCDAMPAATVKFSRPSGWYVPTFFF